MSYACMHDLLIYD